MWKAFIDYDGGTISIDGAPTNNDICIVATGLQGWYSTPDLKVDSAERTSGDGNHKLTNSDIRYAARVVTLSFYVIGKTRDKIIEGMEMLNSISHKIVKMRVIDSHGDTYVNGYVSTDFASGKVVGDRVAGSITLTCPDPARYSHEPSRGYLSSSAIANDGLVFKNGVMQFPLSYGAPANDIGATCTVVNNGSSRAYPVITVSPGFSDVTITNTETGAQIRYVGYIAANLVIDSKTHTANINGVDVTRNLVARGFETIQPHSSATFTLNAEGSGTVEIEAYSTYI